MWTDTSWGGRGKEHFWVSEFYFPDKRIQYVNHEIQREGLQIGSLSIIVLYLLSGMRTVWAPTGLWLDHSYRQKSTPWRAEERRWSPRASRKETKDRWLMSRDPRAGKGCGPGQLSPWVLFSNTERERNRKTNQGPGGKMRELQESQFLGTWRMTV